MGAAWVKNWDLKLLLASWFTFWHTAPSNPNKSLTFVTFRFLPEVVLRILNTCLLLPVHLGASSPFANWNRSVGMKDWQMTHKQWNTWKQNYAPKYTSRFHVCNLDPKVWPVSTHFCQHFLWSHFHDHFESTMPFSSLESFSGTASPYFVQLFFRPHHSIKSSSDHQFFVTR